MANAQTTATKQEIYAVAQRLKHASPVWRAALLRINGAKITKGSNLDGDKLDLDAQRWHITMLGITGDGWSLKEMLDNWIWWAELHHKFDAARRATDGRTDCPYNGQPPAP
ncbi:hypothetical protein RA19_13795 [Leisingera sp. ANG-M1]|uniref:hypothetical protein n=1 Tax=Leisingera sp. ANG-M1 TaxID=1577895 RepID=UPI00057F793B|nr:hypothetical protein [Leisingera sp. ANG-M1]KIC09834.1 hypothetical protein RA19_13795 [Leisingera sp. ANG-M1]